MRTTSHVRIFSVLIPTSRSHVHTMSVRTFVCVCVFATCICLTSGFSHRGIKVWGGGGGGGERGRCASVHSALDRRKSILQCTLRGVRCVQRARHAGINPKGQKKKILNALKKGISSIQAELSDRPVRFYEVKGMIRQKNRDTATKINKRKEKEAKEMFPTFSA